jgi:hypothetical protein
MKSPIKSCVCSLVHVVNVSVVSVLLQRLSHIFTLTVLRLKTFVLCLGESSVSYLVWSVALYLVWPYLQCLEHKQVKRIIPLCKASQDNLFPNPAQQCSVVMTHQSPPVLATSKCHTRPQVNIPVPNIMPNHTSQHHIAIVRKRPNR